MGAPRIFTCVVVLPPCTVHLLHAAGSGGATLIFDTELVKIDD